MDYSVNQFDYDAVSPVGYDFSTCVTRVYKNGPYLELDVVAAIKATRGNFAAMAMLLGRNRTRVRDYVLSRPDIKEVYDDVRACITDEIEQKLIDGALSGDSGNQRFYLERVGRDRGYSKEVNIKSDKSDEGLLIVVGGPPGRDMGLPERLP